MGRILTSAATKFAQAGFISLPDWWFEGAVFEWFLQEKRMKLTRVLALTAAVTLFAGCAPWYENVPAAQRMSFNQMTPAAQRTVRQEIGNQPIAAITREYKYGDPSYRVEVERPMMNPTLWVAADGSIIKESRELVGANTSMNDASGAQSSTSHGKPIQQPKQSSGSIY